MSDRFAEEVSGPIRPTARAATGARPFRCVRRIEQTRAERTAVRALRRPRDADPQKSGFRGLVPPHAQFVTLS